MNQSPRTLTFLSNAAADSAVIGVGGGRWLFEAVATWAGGSIKLQRLGPDGTTFLDVPSVTLSANGVVATQIPDGSYKVVRTGSPTAIYCKMQWMPG